MSKNIVICCDGTANEFAKDRTNVVKLYSTLVHDQPDQCTYYHPGIGTMEPPGALTPLRRRVTRTLGMAIGAYLENDIRDAYVFLMQTYQEHDRVYLFGFSRGAYTARAVASLLRMYGLLRPGNEAMVPYAIRMMMAIKAATKTEDDRKQYQKKVDEYFDLAAGFKATLGRVCKPHFVGVFDTVSSVGWIANPLKLPYVADNGDIAVGRHAVALDERRAFFRTNLWRPRSAGKPNDENRRDATPPGPLDLLQVWFAGVHCDVGGGYPEAESGLSKLALEWMLDEAQQHGLKIDTQKRAVVLGGAAPYVAPNPHAEPHESLSGAWKAAEYVPKQHYDYATGERQWQANRSKRRRVPDHAVIHWSVYERGQVYLSTLGLPPTVTVFPKKP